MSVRVSGGWRVNDVWSDMFVVTDGNGTAVTGLVTANFTALLYKDKVASAQAVAVTEIGGGLYYVTFTPNAAGNWYLLLQHATYGWWDADVQATTRTNDDYAFPLTSGRGVLVDASGGVTSQLDALVVRSGTAQAGGANTITLDAGASATTDLYKYAIVMITSGTGANQGPRAITAYNGGTKVATVSPLWTTNPDATSVFKIVNIPGLTGVDWANIVSQTTTQALSSTSIGAVIGNVGGNVTGSIGSLGTTAKTDVANAVWNSLLATYTTASTFGKLLGGIVFSAAGNVKADLEEWRASVPNALSSGRVDSDPGSLVLRSGTCQAGSASTNVVLDAGASAVNDFYAGAVVVITGGTGAGQGPRAIYTYSGASKTASIMPAWGTTPDGTSTFRVYSFAGYLAADVRSWLGGAVNGVVSGRIDASVGAVANGVIAAASFAAGAIDATAFAQGAADKVWSTTTRALTDKVGFALSAAGVQAIWDALTANLTTVGSIGKLLVTNVDATISSRLATAGYTAPPSVASIVAGVWDELQASHGVAGSFGKLMAFLDAAISSRADGANYTAARATKLDNLDATVSSRATPSDVTTIVGLATANLDAPVSTRATPAQILATPANLLATDASGRVTVGSIVAGAIDTATVTAGYLASVADAWLDRANAIDTYTPRGWLKAAGAAIFGKSSGGPNTPIYRAVDDSKARVTAVCDDDGNRTAVTVDVS